MTKHRRRVALASLLTVALCSAGCPVFEKARDRFGGDAQRLPGGDWTKAMKVASGQDASKFFGMALSGKSKSNQVLLAGVAGVWLANEMGKQLTARDRETLGSQAEQARSTGKPQTYKNPDTGTQINTRVAARETRRETVRVPVQKSRVKQVPPLDLIGETYAAGSGGADLRGGPGTDYVVVETLAPAATMHAIGKVQGQPWLLLGKGGVGTGFASESSVAPAPAAPAADGAAATTKPIADGEVEIVVAREYQTFEQEVVLADGQKSSETVTMREGTAGWEVAEATK